MTSSKVRDIILHMKSGFVVLVGRSNVGKSTLLNALVGSKVAIVTPKAQTTRMPIRGILHDERGQIVFVDTPGIFLGKKDILSKKLNTAVKKSLEGIDAVVYVVDPTREVGAEEKNIQSILAKVKQPVILAINKIDVEPKKRPATEEFEDLDIGQATTVKISASKQKHLKTLVSAIFEILPEGPGYYPEQQITDLGHQQWIQETIREKVFLSLAQELPYTVNVKVNDIKFRNGGGRFIDATIWTTNDRYKHMIIGAGARTIKEIGMKARKELQAALDTPVHLDLDVRVDPKWPEKFSA
ncbi:GTPase Era [Candidatus Uhrbacteria bacterium]|nr:GTPase Era [Candidatus Uhrbacteria bacterium]